MLIIAGFIAFVLVFMMPEVYGEMHNPDFIELFMMTLLLGLLTLASIMLGSGIAFIVGACFPKHWKLAGTDTLVSLRNQAGVSGSFYLGTGTVDSHDYYYYYVGSAEEGYQPRRIKVDENVTIFEEERTDGELKTFSREFKSDIYSLFGLTAGTRYEFRIPKGSLKQHFLLS